MTPRTWNEAAASNGVREGDPRDFNDGLLLLSANIERRIHKRRSGYALT